MLITLEDKNPVIIIKLLTGKYFLIISKFTKPIVIHTINVTVEMMMINGTKYPLNLSASCWMGAYKKENQLFACSWLKHINI